MLKLLSINHDETKTVKEDHIVINYSIYCVYDSNISSNESKHDFQKYFNHKYLIESKTNFSFNISSGNISDNVLSAVKLMSVGEEATFELPASDFEFFEEKDSNLNKYYLKIVVLSSEVKIKSRYEMSFEEKLSFALSKKAEGVELYKRKVFLEAFIAFDVAAGYLLTEKELDQKSKDLLISLLLNISNCANNLEKYDITIVKCSYILSSIKKHPKAFYLRGIAYCNLSSDVNLQNAQNDLNELKLLISNDDQGIMFLESLIKDKRQQIEQSEKSLFKSFFKNKSIYDDKVILSKRIIPNEVNEYNPKVYFDIETNNVSERVEFELFADVVPKTTENFLILADTKKYVGTIFHRLVKDFMIQGGDFENYNGSGGSSIYGKYFEDENFIYGHSQEGLLSMANSGPNKNNSQFFITFKECSWLDNKHVVFGKVIKGMEFIRLLNDAQTGDEDRPLKVIKIIDCGRIK